MSVVKAANECPEPGQAEVFPAVCPVSGLPIRAEADWVYRNPGGTYVTSVALIGERIAMVVAKGYVEEEDMRQAIAVAERFKRQVFTANTRYASIENFTQARGGALAARRRYLEYTNRLKGMMGSFVFGLPPFFRLSFNLTRRLGLHRHKVRVVKDYAAAIQAALALTNEKPVAISSPRVGPARCPDDWPLAAEPRVDRRLKPPPPLRGDKQEEDFRDEVNKLLEFLGGIDPHHPGVRRRRKGDGDPTSPLEPVYGAIELMKQDMDHLVEEQHRMLQALSRRRDELRQKSGDLERQNRELRHLLKQHAADGRALETGIMGNVHGILKPLLEAMHQGASSAEQTTRLERLNEQIDELLGVFAPQLDSLCFNLTPRELRVARLIRDGYRSQQIAARLRIATRTVTTHRTQIRKKLGILKQRRNLRTCLLAIPDDQFDAQKPI